AEMVHILRRADAAIDDERERHGLRIRDRVVWLGFGDVGKVGNVERDQVRIAPRGLHADFLRARRVGIDGERQLGGAFEIAARNGDFYGLAALPAKWKDRLDVGQRSGVEAVGVIAAALVT